MGWVELRGSVAVKTHGAEVELEALRARLRAAKALDGLVVPPLGGVEVCDGRLVTRWPRGEPVDPAVPERYPWGEAGRLLARLHAVEPSTPLPAAGGPARVARAVGRLRAEVTGPRYAAAVRQVLRAHERRAPAPPEAELRLCHGDFHLGQLVLLAGAGWRLIDVDDLGWGDPTWDLGRPAAWYAAGLLPPSDWQRLLNGYGLASVRDPWARVDGAARAFTVQGAARALLLAHGRDAELAADGVALVDSCGRIAVLS
ncbi:phosphotransferase family protein [Streptomyces zhaozhouensis]|nr:aminoglycoside phosphotransferase family protein [Streptomyces zhaozhouensis]